MWPSSSSSRLSSQREIRCDGAIGTQPCVTRVITVTSLPSTTPETPPNPVLIVLALFLIATVLLMSAAAITDYFDGKLARERNLVTTLGTILDPIADKIMVATVILVLAAQGAQRAHPPGVAAGGIARPGEVRDCQQVQGNDLRLIRGDYP